MKAFQYLYNVQIKKNRSFPQFSVDINLKREEMYCSVWDELKPVISQVILTIALLMQE